MENHKILSIKVVSQLTDDVRLRFYKKTYEGF